MEAAEKEEPTVRGLEKRRHARPKMFAFVGGKLRNSLGGEGEGEGCVFALFIEKGEHFLRRINLYCSIKGEEPLRAGERGESRRTCQIRSAKKKPGPKDKANRK